MQQLKVGDKVVLKCGWSHSFECVLSIITEISMSGISITSNQGDWTFPPHMSKYLKKEVVCNV